MYTEICGKMYQTSSSLGEALQLAQSAVGREDLARLVAVGPGERPADVAE